MKFSIHRFILIVICLLGFTVPWGHAQDSSSTGQDYREAMRDFVESISAYAKAVRPGFIIVPQNGHDLITLDGEPDGAPANDYLNAIDGIGREDLLYGYEDDDVPTLQEESDFISEFLTLDESYGVQALVTDYCWTRSHVDDSYDTNGSRGFASFAADHRDLDNIPAYPTAPNLVSAGDIHSLKDVKNFLYLIDPSGFSNKSAYLEALQATDHDLLIIDAFYQNEWLTPSDTVSLKIKANGGARLVISYMSIGEAEDYRFYWNSDWKTAPPAWLAGENPDWEGNYKVRYWLPEWQTIVVGETDSYLGKILDAGFDGVYLDIIDAFEYFEEITSVTQWRKNE